MSEERKLLLEIKNLSTSFFTDAGEVKAVRGINLKVKEGQTLGLVGESGCGKSVTALSIMRLVPKPGEIINGEVIYKGKDLLRVPEKNMREVRGKEVAMIFQEPLTSLNPVFTVGRQIEETVSIHQNASRERVREITLDMLKKVGISEAGKRFRNYPHQLSGGMRQRAMIAMALSCNPEILIADEPTTALDVTIQAQILELLENIQRERKMAVIFITHDLGIVSEFVDNVAIMYCGRIVEYSSSYSLLNEPMHPYTQGLIESIPVLGEDKSKPLKSIRGSVPDLLVLPKGCAFYDRCYKAETDCRQCQPQLLEVKEGHWAACLHV